MRGLDVVRRGPERLRAGAWRGDARVAYLAPMVDLPPPSAAMVRHGCDVLAAEGFTEVVTGALSVREQQGFLAAGFAVREELHLLTHDLWGLPEAPAAPLRRGTRRDRLAALEVDAAAFEPFWRLDEGGLGDAISATPATRFRVAEVEGVVRGYAVAGRAGTRGYLQRLAVHPDAGGRGLGRALATDALRWMRRRGATSAVVNTQLRNERALRLYEQLGFRYRRPGLAVLTRRLEDRQLTS